MRTEKTFIPAHTVTSVYYTYDELKKEAKGKALKDYRKGIDWQLWCDFQKDSFEQDLENHYIPGLENTEVQFSLNCCQGDGVSFTGVIRWNNLEAFLNKVYGENIPRNVKRLIPCIEKISFKRSKSYYCHAYTVSTEIETTSCTFGLKRVEAVLEDIEKEIENFRVGICREMEDNGYESIDYEESEEAAMEYFEANEIEFDAEGIAC